MDVHGWELLATVQPVTVPRGVFTQNGRKFESPPMLEIWLATPISL